MKQRLKQITKFIALCALVVLTSCEKDLYEEEKNEEKPIIEKVSLDDLPFLKNDISQKQKAMKKVASKEGDIDYLSLIRTDEVYMSTDVNGLKTYTFGLNLVEFEKLTNVVVKETLNDGLKYSLVKYTSPQYNEWITSVILNENPEVVPNIEITDLEEKFEMCIEYNIIFRCPSGMHGNGEEGVCNYDIGLWNLTIVITAGACEGSGGSDAGTNNGGSPGTTPGGTTTNTTGTNTNTGTNGGSGIGTTPTIITPVPPFGGSNETIQKTPCESLNKILQTPTSLPAGAISIKDAINQLSNNADDGLDHEEGFNFVFNPTTGQVYATPADQVGDNTIKYSKNPLVFGGAHFHQAGLEPQFSHDDLYVLNMFNTQFSNPNIVNNLQAPLPMHLLVTTDGDIFAIMADDMQAFSSLIYDIYHDEDKRDAFRDKIARRYAKFFQPSTNSYTGDAEDYQETLLKFINDVNNFDGNENGDLSLKLYKATKVNDVLTGEWKELKLKQTNPTNFNNFTIDKINCN